MNLSIKPDCLLKNLSTLLLLKIAFIYFRFNLRSSETGFISIAYDIATICCLVLVTYVGGRGHKPLWLGWGVFIMGCGSILYSLPHFIAPTYDYKGGEGENLCGNVTKTTCQDESLRTYRYISYFF